MGSTITEADIFEKKEDVLISPTGGIPCRKIAHFLKPIVSSPKDSKFKQPFIPPKSRWPLDVAFNGWLEPLHNWSKWVDAMLSKYSDLWKRAGILEAILGSKYKFHRVDELVFGIAERWNCDTNTFVFPWGEATITLEDMLILGGFSVLGAPVFQPVEDADSAKICKELSKVLIKNKMQTHCQWLHYFRNKREKYEHEAFISLWLSMFVFPGTEYDRVAVEVFPIAVSLAKGTRFALGPAVLATIYRDMSVLKVSMDASIVMEAEEGEGHLLALSLWAPLYLVQLWAWERFIQFRAEPNSLNKDEPRVARWNDLKRLDIGNVRPIISSSGEVFLWRPYCLSVDNWPFPMFYKEKQEWISVGLGQYLDNELESFVKCLRVCFLVGVDCGEPYYPHRVAMQFGFDQDIPEWIPRSKFCPEVAWIDYSRPFVIAAKLELPPRLAESDMSTRYLDWWRKDVLLLPVESFCGLVQKKRSSRRRAMKHAAAEFDVPPGSPLKEAVEFDVPPDFLPKAAAELDVPPGFLPKANVMPGNSQISNSMLENGWMLSPAKDKFKIADVPPGSIWKAVSEFHVPPGYPPKEAVAEFNVLTDFLPKAAAELDVPPGFLPKANVMPGRSQMSNSMLENGRMEPPTKHKMKIAAAEFDVPPGFHPNANAMQGNSSTMLESGKMELSAKLKVKTEPADLDVLPGFPPKVQYSTLQKTLEQQQSSGRNVANEVKDISYVHSEAIFRSTTSTVRASGILQPTPNAYFELSPQSLSDLNARLGKIHMLLEKLKNQKINQVMK